MSWLWYTFKVFKMDKQESEGKKFGVWADHTRFEGNILINNSSERKMLLCYIELESFNHNFPMNSQYQSQSVTWEKKRAFFLEIFILAFFLIQKLVEKKKFINHRRTMWSVDFFHFSFGAFRQHGGDYYCRWRKCVCMPSFNVA